MAARPKLAGSGAAVIDKLSNIPDAPANAAGPIGPPYELAFVKVAI
jgi:hypothetical protein